MGLLVKVSWRSGTHDPKKPKSFGFSHPNEGIDCDYIVTRVHGVN